MINVSRKWCSKAALRIKLTKKKPKKKKLNSGVKAITHNVCVNVIKHVTVRQLQYYLQTLHLKKVLCTSSMIEIDRIIIVFMTVSQM